MEFCNTLWCIGAASVHTDDAHSERRASGGGFGANTTDADDQCRALRQVKYARVEWRWRPPMLHLEWNVAMRSARECEDKCHDVRRDVLIEYAAEIGDRHRVRLQLRKVVASRRRNSRCLQPLQTLRACNQFGRQRAKGGIRILNLASGL